jgi:multicomponent K+:H+ antiporter subunit A
MLLAPAIPAVLSLLLGVLPEPEPVAKLLALAAADIFGSPVKVSLALWNGINVPLFLSAVAIGVGCLVFYYRKEFRTVQQTIASQYSWNRVYEWVIASIDRAGNAATQLQVGKLRVYLGIMIVGMLALISLFIFMMPIRLADILDKNFISLSNLAIQPDLLIILRVFTLLLILSAALATILLRRDIYAIVASGVTGLSVSILFVLEPAPDVALVQIVVDILAVVILVLALSRIPRSQRIKASEFTFLQSRPGLIRDLVVSILAGAVVTILTFGALTSRPRTSQVTPYYEAVAKPLTGAKDIIGAIIVDFRATDTLIEILVFSLAGLGIYTLLHYAARTHGDHGSQIDETPYRQDPTIRTYGIGGPRTSSFIHALAYIAFPIALTVAITHILFGHDQPGDGFTAGVIFSLSIGFWYIVFGYEQTRQRLSWLKPGLLVGCGILLVIFTASTAFILSGDFLAPINFGDMLNLPLPEGIYFNSGLLFELAIFLVVTGSVTYMLNSLGHPGQATLDVTRQTEHLSELEK